ncbi:MAG: protein tyrosine phosphatase [Acidipropionibacterium sp.]|jgi:protein-tyrosine-phosphatase|nr:protein tyrosine phosphatase [Acidipropionibacterium sp.]
MSRLHLHFVCTANVCRSAYASLRALTILSPRDFAASSSGLQAHPGEPIYVEMAEQLRRRGVDPGGQASRRTETVDIQDADLVLTMASWQRTTVLENWPDAVTRVFTLPQFVASARTPDALSLITSSSDKSGSAKDIIVAAYRHRVPASSVGDVADPYNQGPEAAATCATTLDRLLTELDDLLAPARPPRRAAV